METLTRRSAAIDRVIQRTQEIAPYLPANDTAPNDCFPPPYLDDDLAIPAMMGVYGVEQPSRLRRGGRKLTFSLAGACLAIALGVALILGFTFGLVMWGLESLSAIGRGG